MDNTFKVGDEVEVKDFFGREGKVCFGLTEFILIKLRVFEMYLSYGEKSC